MTVVVIARDDRKLVVCRQQDAGSKRTVGNGVDRCDRRDLHQIQTRIDNRAAQRIVVGGAACRGGDTDAVTAETLDKGIVDGDIQLYRIVRHALDGNFVERDLTHRAG